ncbi:hypothetical protein K432DRAFT_444161 [Lepidopterella palustris CBS 459.81]|uniref:RBR-type E3 ubiquitin transferase n=1 Tax=Lepidopterella palustris CBS 459.81 TaxID=1314670 RepID=A0A8E2E800_9PEZI|nr:hypothetical protein K432DRAFT_444161 [Lepidopterella palustris CBS 459.81]
MAFTCSVCGSRKPADDYPLAVSGTRSVGTCTECLKQNLRKPSAADWEALGFQPPELEYAPVPGLAPESDPDPAPSAPSTPSTTHKRKRRNTTGWPTARRKRAKAAPKSAEEPGPITCRICVEEKPIEDFPKFVYSKKNSNEIPYQCVKHLAHKRRSRTAGNAVCKSCIGASLAAGLDSVGAERIGCLEPGCTSEPWEYPYLAQYLSAEALERYHEQMFTVFMTEASTMVCLNPKCGAVGLLEKAVAGFPNVVCSECKHRSCALCAVDWHDGLSCHAYRAKHQKDLVTNDEKATLRALSKKGAKWCPRCQMAIEKDGGCDSMYCMYCRRYFAWYSAEPVRAFGSKKAAPKLPAVPDYWNEVCEEDAVANPPPPAGLPLHEEGELVVPPPGLPFPEEDVLVDFHNPPPNHPLF